MCVCLLCESIAHISATVIVRTGGAILVEPLSYGDFNVCSAVTVECCVLYPCYMDVVGMFAVI